MSLNEKIIMDYPSRINVNTRVHSEKSKKGRTVKDESMWWWKYIQNETVAGFEDVGWASWAKKCG